MQQLKITNLHKSFGELEVLKGVDLSAQSGEVVALIGRSGSGKSTLLRCINQLEMPQQGTIEVGDLSFEFGPNALTISAEKQRRLRTQVGMVFQHFNLWAHKTLLENMIEAPLRVNGEAEASAIPRARALLHRVGIGDKAHTYPDQLSGGQKQRGAIARALMMKPEAMLFDEPTSALDPEMVGEVLAVIQDLAQEHGMIMLIATHELNFARKIADQTIFLEQGRIIEAGDTEHLFQHPKSSRLQQFLQSAGQHQSGKETK